MHHPRQHQLYESHSARTLGSCLILKALGTRRAANPRAYPKTVDLHSLTSQFPPLKYEHFPPMESATLTSPFEKPIRFSCLQVVKFPTAGFSLRSTIRFLFYRINFPNSLIAFFGVKNSPSSYGWNCVIPIRWSRPNLQLFSLFIGRVRYPIAHTTFSTSSFWYVPS